MEGAAGDLLEAVHQPGSGEVEPAGQRLDGQVLVKVGVDIGQNLLNLGIRAEGMAVGQGQIGLVAPVEGGEKAGVLYLRYRGEVIAEIPLVTRNSVEKSSFLQITTGIVNFIKTPGFIITVVIIVLAAIAGVFVTAAYRYRRAVRRRYRNSTK